jgi:hypothetical protein
MGTSTIIYSLSGGQVTTSADATTPAFYRDALLVHTFKDVFGHVTAAEAGLLHTDGEVFYSSTSSYEPEYARNFYIGSADGQNGCWAPEPATAIPEYVGVRFTVPVTVTGFQFASGLHNASQCPYGTGPCAYPTAFTLEASNDDRNWTVLLSMTHFTGMRVATESLFDYEESFWWDGGVSLSDRLDVPNQHAYLAYRLAITAFKPDIYGRYNISELLFYGTA